jgi:hypothetical protein
MRPLLAAILVVMTLAGCATAEWPLGGATSLLARADRLADRQQYDPALRIYDEFLTRYPADPAAPRALKSRDTIASIVTARAELAARDAQLAKLRGELAARDAELAKLRQESERLRADLEKLKEVDLNLERKKR